MRGASMKPLLRQVFLDTAALYVRYTSENDSELEGLVVGYAFYIFYKYLCVRISLEDELARRADVEIFLTFFVKLTRRRGRRSAIRRQSRLGSSVARLRTTESFLVSASSHTWSFSWTAQSTARLNTNREARPYIPTPTRSPSN